MCSDMFTKKYTYIKVTIPSQKVSHTGMFKNSDNRTKYSILWKIIAIDLQHNSHVNSFSFL